MEPGFYNEKQDIPQMDYISWSKCREIQNSPRAFYRKYKEGFVQESSAAMDFGALFHAMALEPSKVEQRFAQIPDFGPMQSSTNRAKRDSWKAEHQWATCVTASDIALAKELVERIKEHPSYSVFLTGGMAEPWGYAKRSNGGWLMGRPDYVVDDCVVELKTTSKGVDMDSFQKEILNRGYHVQLAMNIQVASMINNKPYGGAFVVVSTDEKNPEAAIYTLSNDVLREGLVIATKGIELLDWFLGQDKNMENKALWQLQQEAQELIVAPYFIKNPF